MFEVAVHRLARASPAPCRPPPCSCLSRAVPPSALLVHKARAACRGQSAPCRWRRNGGAARPTRSGGDAWSFLEQSKQSEHSRDGSGNATANGSRTRVPNEHAAVRRARRPS
uniref:Uncharacterized protein n=1 Tax=Arundo donax TaxID=35708 RepID=A0A0A9FZK5_ARUDO